MTELKELMKIKKVYCSLFENNINEIELYYSHYITIVCSDKETIENIKNKLATVNSMLKILRILKTGCKKQNVTKNIKFFSCNIFKNYAKDTITFRVEKNGYFRVWSPKYKEGDFITNINRLKRYLIKEKRYLKDILNTLKD